MRYSFYAFISRLKNITRWSLMRNNSVENVQEHSHMVAVIAHALAVIRRDVLGGDADPGMVAAAALFHDASEIFTGDMPTPIKYHDPDIMMAYKRVEATASRKLLSALPAEMRPAYEPLLSHGAGSPHGGAAGEAADGTADGTACEAVSGTISPDYDATTRLVKAADSLAAYIKCLEELKTGNHEFRLAAEQQRKKLATLAMPEVEYFIERFIPAFELSLDELDFSFEK